MYDLLMNESSEKKFFEDSDGNHYESGHSNVPVTAKLSLFVRENYPWEYKCSAMGIGIEFLQNLISRTQSFNLAVTYMFGITII